ncbi:MAG: GNAT family N-acetyltransferase [Anaeroplasmataceae bacterium]|nr:GNAT family N-acetyltransferase [Anaeroplasmataceae bacterium]
MIKNYTKYDLDNVTNFILPLLKEEKYCNPNFYIEQDILEFLNRAVENEERETFLIYNSAILGVFSFIILPIETYIEMTMAYSKDTLAYEEMFHYLQEKYKNYSIFLYFHPKHFYFYPFVKNKNAILYPEQFQMKLYELTDEKHDKKIVAYKDKFSNGYRNIHSTDLYWTAEKVINEMKYKSRPFQVFLAVVNKQVVGYVDIQRMVKEENSYFINDILVLNEYQGQGIGKALLKEAFKKIKPQMFLLSVDEDNKIAQRVYTTLGFKKVERSESVLAEFKL